MRPTVSGAATHFPSSECLVSQTRLRFTHLFAVLLSAAPLVQPTVAHAQGGQIELRLDAVRVQSMSKNLLLGVSVPGSAAIAWYLTKDYTSTVVSPDGSTIWYVNSHVDFLPYICAFMAVLVFYKHKENILRLLKGQEPKIGKKNDPAKTTG